MTACALFIGAVVLLICVIFPPRWREWTLNSAVMSFFVLAALLAGDALQPADFVQGLLGGNNLQPWKIFVIFFTTAYAAVSTDITGVFDRIAFRIVRMAAGNTRRLFAAFFIFASLLTIFTSNDIVILTLTPIIFYLGRHSSLNIVPFLFAEFFAANTLSMLLVIGNPTNIIVANALKIGFAAYFSVMVVPTIAATLLTFALLRWLFRRQLRVDFTLKATVRASPNGSFDVNASVLLMLSMLLTLLFSEPLGLPIWQITTGFCALFLLENIWLFWRRRIKTNDPQAQCELYGEPQQCSDFRLSFMRMPWQIAPLLFAFFVIVGALAQTAPLALTTGWLASISTSVGTGVAAMGSVALLAANLMNNQPMTILLANMMLGENYVVMPEVAVASGFALIIASNLAANLTLFGALAGLMWRRILADKSVVISYWQFLRVGLAITPLVFVTTLLTLVWWLGIITGAPV